jgi:hypothetical protein
MTIDEHTYILSDDNFVQIETLKKHIIIGHTFNHDMKHYTGWLHRYNGKFKKTAAFTIDTTGFIYKHFKPKYHSRYFNDKKFDKKVIVILLENDGWLMKNGDKNEFITWIGDIYKQPNEVVEKKWRGYSYWSSYTKEQLDSVQDLVRSLCEEFNLPLSSVAHNTAIDRLDDYMPILYRSNLNKNFTDLSPAWDCNGFKEMLENK